MFGLIKRFSHYLPTDKHPSPIQISHEVEPNGLSPGGVSTFSQRIWKSREERTAKVKSLLKLRKLNGNLTSMENVLFSMAKTVEAKDRYTQEQVDRVCHLALAIGRGMELTDADLEALRFGAVLHDIGKMGVPEEILNKPGPLDERERKVIESHAEVGYRICLPLKKNLRAALDVVRHHHEKLDRSRQVPDRSPVIGKREKGIRITATSPRGRNPGSNARNGLLDDWIPRHANDLGEFHSRMGLSMKREVLSHNGTKIRDLNRRRAIRHLLPHLLGL